MFHRNATTLVLLLAGAIALVGCTSKDPYTEKVKLPSGETMERTAVAGPMIKKLAVMEVTGKIQLVEMPGPDKISKGTELVSLVLADGEPVIVVKDDKGVLRKSAGKTATIKGELQRGLTVFPKYKGQGCKIYKLVDIKEIK